MRREVDNRNKDSNFYGPYAGRDLYITMYQDSEREFVVTHNVNIKPVSYFTGRETELKDLRRRIEEGRKSVLVSGMGGIGKTHICKKLFVEYLNKYAENGNGPFCHIGYIEYVGDMNNSLQNCLKYKEQDDPKQNYEAAWRELEYLAADGKLLLFVDNVSVPVGEDAGLERLKSIPGAVVLTSRRTSFSKEFEPYRIGFLSTEQCVEMYERIRYEDSGRKVSKDELPDLEYVIDILAAGHTITVEFLAHLSKTKHLTAKELRNELESKGFQLKYRNEEDQLINIQEEYEKLYDLSVLDEAEQNILEAFSMFPYISLSAKICNQWLLSDAGVSEDDDIFAGLHRKGWLQFDMEQGGYALHPVFAKFIYEKCKPQLEEHHGLVEGCRKCLAIPENGSAIECQNFIPFAENIMEKSNMKESMEYIQFINILAELLHYIGEYTRAEALYKKSLQINKKLQGEEHPDTAASYNNLAIVYESQGKYEEAEGLYRKALLIKEKILGEEHPETARGYNNLAVVYKSQGKYKEAEGLYRKVLLIREKVLGEEHPETAGGYNNLAVVYKSQGEYEEAEELCKKALLINEKILGEEHPSTATSYNNLAEVYKSQGKYEEAEGLYRKALLINEKVLGEGHPLTAASYNNLAGVYISLEKHEEAERLYKKALLISEKVLGEGHPDTAASYSNLAVVYMSQGKYEKAKGLYRKALLISGKVLGEEHPSTATIYNNLAVVYESQGKYEEAEGLYKKVILIREKVLGKEHPDTAISYNNLAGVYYKQKKYDISLTYSCAAYQMFVSKFGVSHPNTKIAHKNLQAIYTQCNSEGDFEQWLEEKRKEWSENHDQDCQAE